MSTTKAMIYKQKDLGYPRSPTSAKLHVTMPDLSVWSVPLQIVADSRDEHYADEKEDTVALCREDGDAYELKDWAAGNMNWDEVARYAERVPVTTEPDFQEGWVNGDKEVEGEI